jgi:threonine/homoserine/homoserine lactone efflux protein
MNREVVKLAIMELIGIVELIAGILINIFIGTLGQAIFRKDDRTSRVILRVIGVFLIINGISRAFHV